MHNIFLVVLVIGFFIQPSHVANAAQEFDLTSQEERAINKVMEQHNFASDPDQDERVHLTLDMARQFPRTAVQKMLSTNEAFLQNPDDGTTPEELVRLQQEANIFRQALANQ
jgi:hypothetical protein